LGRYSSLRGLDGLAGTVAEDAIFPITVLSGCDTLAYRGSAVSMFAWTDESAVCAALSLSSSAIWVGEPASWFRLWCRKVSRSTLYCTIVWRSWVACAFF